MYLSRLILNSRSRQVQRELADPYEMHRTISRAFPNGVFSVNRQEDTTTGALFRVDVHPHTGIPTLLVQSHQEPDWSFLLSPEKNYLLPTDALPLNVENPAMKQVDLQLQTGQVLAFRLRANPTKRLKDSAKRVGLVREEEQLAWLRRKIEMAGGVLVSAQLAGQANLRGKLFTEKDDERRMRFVSTQFDGVLQVKNPDLMVKTIGAGLGSGKGLGFGLLSLAPVRGSLQIPCG
jgi:CRISPR system Cascade subunit CasE